jgi:CRISPR-associated protein Csx17
LPLEAAKGCSAHLDDLAEFLAGTIDLGKVFDLARAFMAITWKDWRPEHFSNLHRSSDKPEEAWLALRLACLPWPLDSRDIPAEPNVVPRLLAGDSAVAVSIALRRLRSAGIRPPLQAGATDAATARLWAAALVFPINHDSALRAAVTLDPAMKGPIHA